MSQMIALLGINSSSCLTIIICVSRWCPQIVVIKMKVKFGSLVFIYKKIEKMLLIIQISKALQGLSTLKNTLANHIIFNNLPFFHIVSESF